MCRRVRLSLALLNLLVPLIASAQGGPPFRTDDPETPGNLRTEFNVGFSANRGAASGKYALPELDANLGLGRRAQLRYILPLEVAETRKLAANGADAARSERVLAGLGESLFGLKYRFYEHTRGGRWLGVGPSAERSLEKAGKSREGANERGDEQEATFSASLFPQVTVNNPTRSVARGVVEPGPDFLLPLEIAGRIGWLRWNGEVGYHFANSHLPQSWVRGLVVGREFGRSTEGYLELYDVQDANRVGDEAKHRQTTLSVGGRQTLNKHQMLVLLVMGGRSFEGVSETNTQPSWITYAGLRFLIGTSRKLETEREQKQPGEDR